MTATEKALLRLLKAARIAEIDHSTVYTVDNGAMANALDVLAETGINPNTGERMEYAED